MIGAQAVACVRRRLRQGYLPALLGLSLLATLLLAAGHPPSAAGQAMTGVQGPQVGLGGRVAFIRNGDVYTLDLASGSEVRLTDDGAASQPRWSPSGQWIAYRNGQSHVWIMQADGSRAHALAGGADVSQFAWSPAADVLGYIARGVFTESASGSARQTILSAPDDSNFPQVFNLAWSPNGDWLAYDLVEMVAPGVNSPGGRLGSLWRVRADGSDAAEVIDAGEPESYRLILAGWSPEGGAILYWADQAFSASLLADGAPLFAVPARGGRPVELAKSTLAFRDFVVPEADRGDRVAVVEGGGREDWTGKSLHVVNAGTADGVALTGPDVNVSSPAWSPDGRYLAYVSMPDAGNVSTALGITALMQRRIVVIDALGKSPPRQLTDDPDYRDESPHWSADGSTLLFARIDAPGNASLWSVPAVGGPPTELVDNISPAPDATPRDPRYAGFFGRVGWGALFDFWPGPTQR